MHHKAHEKSPIEKKVDYTKTATHKVTHKPMRRWATSPFGICLTPPHSVENIRCDAKKKYQNLDEKCI